MSTATMPVTTATVAEPGSGAPPVVYGYRGRRLLGSWVEATGSIHRGRGLERCETIEEAVRMWGEVGEQQPMRGTR